MPRWKDSRQIFAYGDEVFDENWMNYDRISQYAPPNPAWSGGRPMRVEDVEIWEVITEMTGPVGVYAAWCPYDEFYVVMRNWSIAAEFSGWNANTRLEKYLIEQHIPYPRSADKEVAPFEKRLLVVG